MLDLTRVKVHPGTALPNEKHILIGFPMLTNQKN